ASMYVGGITQGLMWRAMTDEGTLLYPNFLETVLAERNMYYLRALGGALYLGGFALMAWNLIKTALSGSPATVTVSVAVETESKPQATWAQLAFSPVLAVTVVGLLLLMSLGVKNTALGVAALVALAVFCLAAWSLHKAGLGRVGDKTWHELLEGKAMLFTVLTLVAVLVGGMVQILPTVLNSAAAVPLEHEREPTLYSPLELAGRDIYRREGCYLCHTQMIRELSWEALRYGKPSEAWESKYDHPFQWGSKRNGPDLARVGGKYPDLWHYRHLTDPRSTSEGSIMPSYAFLSGQKVDREQLPKIMKVMRTVGVPYTDDAIASGAADAKTQAGQIADGLKAAGAEKADPDSELVALIAYLQHLGIDNK
ncbi:MAG TPA: cytochrome-c oxidase, cbb3-type subunit II, partial [bacterium]|nr:cytochrome-c oxidase, cbb3-type subunit II [bacterium]